MYKLNRNGPRPPAWESLPEGKRQFSLLYSGIELWLGDQPFALWFIDKLWIEAVRRGDPERRFLSKRTLETYILRLYDRGMLFRDNGMGGWELSPRYLSLTNSSHTGSPDAISPTAPSPAIITDEEELARILGVDPRTGKKIGG